MTRTVASLPGGPRLSDHLSLGVLAHVFPRPMVRALLEACGRTSQRRRDLSAEVMVYFVLALELFRSVSTREVLRCLAEGLLWHARRDTPLLVQRVLADGFWLSRYGDRTVRVVEYVLAKAPDETYRLVTTLRDPEAALYHEHWEIETACDELKTHMLGPRPILCSKTPELVQQEVEGLMLAEAADDEALDPDDLSFVHAVRLVRHRLQNPDPQSRSRAARVLDLCREIPGSGSYPAGACTTPAE